MACNTCSKSFSLLRKEQGCPNCGFSYCSKCLKYNIFVDKLNCEAKVCVKCERDSKSTDKTKIQPPDVYYKRIGAMDDSGNISNSSNVNLLNTVAGSSKDQEILDRLKKLKEDTTTSSLQTTEDIANRLQKIKGNIPTLSDADLQLRLANIRGVPVSTLHSKPIAIVPDSRTEQEQVEDLLKQYMEQSKIDANYQDEFQDVIENIQTRLQKLKTPGATDVPQTTAPEPNVQFENEEDIINKLITKIKAESCLENEVGEPEFEELPFCEICNEDAKVRCLGCKYLFCTQCYKEHEDENDGCNKYVTYQPLKNS